MREIWSIPSKSRRGLKVRAAIRSGGIDCNHSRRLMAVGQ